MGRRVSLPHFASMAKHLFINRSVLTPCPYARWVAWPLAMRVSATRQGPIQMARAIATCAETHVGYGQGSKPRRGRWIRLCHDTPRAVCPSAHWRGTMFATLDPVTVVLRLCRAPPALIVALAVVACAEEVGPATLSMEVADAGPGRADLGAGRADAGLTVALPVLRPCPEGWAERLDDALGMTVCEPWPEASPVVWDCPQGWLVTEEAGVETCEPSDASPVDWACADGWRTVEVNGVQTCDPFPVGGAATCGPYEAHFPGAPGCSLIGTRCPVGDFPEGLPSDGDIVYVQEGALGGDGSVNAPYGALQDVPFPDLSPDTVVALAKGRYAGAVEPVGRVVLWGACPEETILTVEDDGPRQGILQVSTPGTDVTAKSLRISGGTRLGALVNSASILRLEGVIVEQTFLGGIFVEEGGTLFLEGSVIRDTRPGPGGVGGTGLQVNSGGSATVRRVLIERNHFIGLAGTGAGTTLYLEDVVVRDTQSRASDGQWGVGLSLQSDVQAEAHRVALEGNRGFGVLLTRESRLVLEDAVVRNTESLEASQAFGRGLNLQSGASAEVRGAVFERNRELGVFAAGSMTELVLNNVVVRDTRSRASDRLSGSGLNVGFGARAKVRRAVFEGNRSVQILTEGAETTLILDDALVRDAQGRALDQRFGVGLSVESGSWAEVRRSVFAHNLDIGVFVGGAESALVAEDILVEDTRSSSFDNADGRGLNVESGGRAVVKRARFERNRVVGVLVVDEGSELVVENAVIRDTESRAADGTLGNGLGIQLGARAQVRRVVLAGNRSVGVQAFGPGSELLLEDALIRDTRSQASDGQGGRGLVVDAAARATVRRVLMERNRDVAVFAGGADTELSMEDAVVRDTLGAAADQRGGRGLSVGSGAQAQVSRAVFERNRDVGLLVSRSGSRLSGEDIIVQDTRELAANGLFGRGVGLQDGAQADLRRVVLHRNRAHGVFAGGSGTEFRLEDAWVRQTQGQVSDGRFGRGLDLQPGVRAEVRRARIEQSQEFAVLALGASLTLSDSEIDGVGFSSCGDAVNCPYATGVMASGEAASARLDRTTITGAEQCGVFQSDGAQLDGADLVLSGNGGGLCISDPNFKPSRVRATYSGNIEPRIFENLPGPPPPT